MPRVSTAYVKNIVRRGFNELIDPEPDGEERNRIWAHFESACAYCGANLSKEKREGRIDHAVSASDAGSNSLANRVLACGPCNDHEKRDEHWEAFLRRKNSDQRVYAERRERILTWIQRHRSIGRSTDLTQAAKAAADEVNALFDAKVAEVRALMRVMTNEP